MFYKIYPFQIPKFSRITVISNTNCTTTSNSVPASQINEFYSKFYIATFIVFMQKS